MELWYYLGLFARVRWWQLRNGWRASPAAGCGALVLIVAVPVVAVAAVVIARLATQVVASSPGAGVLPHVPGGLLTVVLFATVLGGVTGALQSLFLATDIEPLLATPAPPPAVFLARLLNSLVGTLLIALLGLAPLVGYGLALGYGAAYFVLLLPLLAALVLLPSGLGTILAMVVIRIAPSGFTRDFINVMGVILGLGSFALAQLLPRVGEQALPLLGVLSSPLLPSTWAGWGLVAAGEGRWAEALAPLALVGALAAAVFAASLWLAEQVFANGVTEMAAARGGRPRVGSRAPRTAPARGRPAAKPRSIAAVILRKELRTYPRDTTYLQPLLYGLFLGGTWLWGAFRGDGSVFGGIGAAVGNPLAALFIATLVAQHPGLSAISREGEGIWQLRIAPASGAEIALGKQTFIYLLYLVIGVPYVLVAGLLARLDAASLLAGAVAVALLGWGCAAILIQFAVRFPRLAWKTTAEQVPAWAGVLVLPTLGTYGLLGVSLLLAYRLAPAGPPQLALFVLGLAVSTGLTWLLHRWTLATADHCLAAIE